MSGDKLALGAVAALAALGLANKRRGSRAPYLDEYGGFTMRRAAQQANPDSSCRSPRWLP
jgi:hypothetical protein